MNKPDITIYGGGEREAGEDGLIQPTADEAKNGWTAESLTSYIRKRENAAVSRKMPATQQARRNPFRR